MIAAVAVLAGVIAVLVGVLVVELSQAAKERAAWAEERRALVDRAIARHTGEVIALDREAERPHSSPKEPVDHFNVVGLS